MSRARIIDSLKSRLGGETSIGEAGQHSEAEIDFSPARETDEKLQETPAARAAEVEKISHELEAFSYAVSRHLRFRLRAIDAYGKALLNEPPNRLTPMGRKQIKHLIEAAEHMASLSNDLMQLSRIGLMPLRIERLKLSVMAKHILFDLQKSQPKRIADFLIQPDVMIWGDRRLLRTAFGHVLENAWKFTDGVPRTEIKFGMTRIENEDVLFVRDNGVGFDPADKDRVFIPFERLNPRGTFPGNGLGLALVRRIIHRHHGRVWAEGRPNRGAAFYISLPKEFPL